jgi:diguanylate cyclase (GGDEF)-like protein
VAVTWSTYQLAEYLAAVSCLQQEAAAIELGIGLAAEFLEAEIGAVVMDDLVVGLHGLDDRYSKWALGLVRGHEPEADLPDVGRFYLVAVDLGREVNGRMLLGRAGEAFSAEERQVLAGMARVLGLSLRSQRTLDAERLLREKYEHEASRRLELVVALRGRELLLQTVFRIQQSISHHEALPEILRTITSGAAELLGVRSVTLVRTDRDKDLVVLSSSGPPPGTIGDQLRMSATSAMSAGGDGHPVVGPGGLLAISVHVGGHVVGALVAGDSEGHWTSERQELLVAFAEQVSLALTDADMADALIGALNDPLTGLANRALFLERLRVALSSPSGLPRRVLFIDLDGFKAINDSLGHQAGDEVLAVVARRLERCVRKDDTVARIGGDEFAVLYEGTDDSGTGVEVAERIVAAIEQPIVIGDHEIAVSGSVGLAMATDVGQDPADLLSSADVAMYRAKKQGPGKVVTFEEWMHAERLQELQLGGDLRKALREGQLWVQYQPLVLTHSGRPVGLEALVRWAHPVLGAVSPLTFIPLAERSRLIRDLGRWVLASAAGQVAAWQKRHSGLTLSVNVSTAELSADGFCQNVAAVLEESGLAAHTLTLEITEPGLADNPAVIDSVFWRLAEMGVKISIDGFGTGYSSISKLRTRRVDQIKIDRSFLVDIGVDVVNLAVVTSLVGLANSLGIETVATGIETEDQLMTLRNLGCRLGQGHLFAPPLSPDQTEAWLEAWLEPLANPARHLPNPEGERRLQSTILQH